MTVTSMFDFASKTFWLGAVMVLAGIGKITGVPFIVDILNGIYPDMDGGALISAGLAAIFVKDAIAKTAPPSA